MNSGLMKWSAALAVFGILAAPVIGFSHAVVPHTHSHTADNALHSVIEHGLESSLSRKEFGTAVLAPWIAFFFILSVHVASRAVLRSPFVSPYTLSLRRGIVPYRAFR